MKCWSFEALKLIEIGVVWNDIEAAWMFVAEAAENDWSYLEFWSFEMIEILQWFIEVS